MTITRRGFAAGSAGLTAAGLTGASLTGLGLARPAIADSSPILVGWMGALTGPLAAAVIIAAGLLARRLSTRIKRLEATLHPTFNTKPSTINASNTPIAVDSPPLPQRTVPETHYVPVEQDTFAKAHQWASEHVARKYPGAAEVLQAQDSLIKQFLAAK